MTFFQEAIWLTFQGLSLVTLSRVVIGWPYDFIWFYILLPPSQNNCWMCPQFVPISLSNIFKCIDWASSEVRTLSMSSRSMLMTNDTRKLSSLRKLGLAHVRHLILVAPFDSHYALETLMQSQVMKTLFSFSCARSCWILSGQPQQARWRLIEHACARAID